MRQTFILLLAVLMLLAENAAATGTTYNQTFADTDNIATWAAISAGYYTYWAGHGGQLPILVINTSTTTTKNGINVTIHSGPFIQGVMGDKLYTLSANKTYILGPFETSRFKQLNGTLLVQSNATRGKAIAVSVAS